MGNIYIVLLKKDGKVIAAQETFESWDDAIGDIIAYDKEEDALAIIELEENGKTQSSLGAELESAIGQFKGESK
jgi:hypothetical protein